MHKLKGGAASDFKYFCATIKDVRTEFEVARSSKGGSTSIFRMICLDKGYGKWDYKVTATLMSVHHEKPQVGSQNLLGM